MLSLDTSKLRALMPAESDKMALAIATIRPGYDLEKLAQSGIFQTAQINDGDTPCYVIWFRTVQDHLIVEMVAGLKITGLKKMLEGFDILARSLKCAFVEGFTKSPGLADFYLANGFEATGLHVRRKING